MATYYQPEPTRTYATEANAHRAVEASGYPDHLRYMLMQIPDGRWFPVSIGQDAVQCGVHWKFNVVG